VALSGAPEKRGTCRSLDAPAVALQVFERGAHFRADLRNEAAATHDRAARLGNVGGAITRGQDAVHGRLHPLGFDVELEGFAEHQGGAEDGADGAGHVFPDELWRRAVDGLEKRRAKAGAHRRHQPDRADDQRCGARDVKLTDAGALLRDYAERLLNLREEIGRGMRDLGGLRRGHLSLGVNESSIHALLPALARFRRLHPRVYIAVHRTFSRDIPREVVNYRLDLGVVSFAPQDAKPGGGGDLPR